MRRRSVWVIWSEVQKGLAICQLSGFPLSALTKFLGELSRIGWHPADVRKVGQCIVELLTWRRENQAGTESCQVAC
jgi:hypothetical protein